MTDTETPVVDLEAARQARRRVIGQDAEAALRERHAKAHEAGDLFFNLRGEDYRVLDPLPAGVIVNATQVQNGDDVDLAKFVTAISQAIHDDDKQRFVNALFDTSVEFPADIEFLADVLNAIVEASTNRPTSK